MSAWKPWPHEECPECGDDVEIQTDAPDGYAYDSDPWRCVEGHRGTMLVDPEMPSAATTPASIGASGLRWSSQSPSALRVSRVAPVPVAARHHHSRLLRDKGTN